MGMGGWRKWSFTVALLAGLCLSANATLVWDNFTSGRWSVGETLPDYNINNPQGWQDSQTVTVGSGLEVTDVRVSLNISGGWNGDLYGYLRHDDGVNPVGFIVLLNRPGYSGSGLGYGDAGFDITLSDVGAAGAIESYQSVGYSLNGNGQLTGTWQANTGDSFATAFGGIGLNPNGTWTLFLQDLATGDQSTLVSWGLQIDAVPEPVTWALIIFGGVLGIVWLARSKWVREQIAHCRAAITAWLDAA